MPVAAKISTWIALALMAAVTVGASSAMASGPGEPMDPNDPPPPRGPIAPIELPGAETP